MKEKWTYKKLGEVCDEALSFKWIDGVEKTYIDLTSVNRETHTIVDPIVVDSKNAPSRAKQIVKGGDILFGTTRPMMKRVCVIEDAFDEQICSTGFCVLRPEQNVLTRWIFYNLLSNSFYSYIEPLQNGVAYPAVSNKEVRDFSIPVPPIETQSRIVSELDLLQSIIDKQKAQLKELDNLAQAVFYDMFGDPVENDKGWEVKKLGEICSLKAGKAIKASELSDNIAPSLFPCYGGNGVRGYINKYSHAESYPIVGRQGALCGNVNFAEAPFYATEHAVVVKPIKNINSKWLFFQLKAMRLNQYAHGVAQPGLAVQDLEPLDCILSPLSLQQSFAAKIDSIEKQKAAITQSIAETQRLFDYTMDKYFG